MQAIAAAQAAFTYATKALAKHGSANKQPAFGTDMELTKWKIELSAVSPKGKPMGTKARLDSLRDKTGFATKVWDIPSVIAYGKAAAKMGVGNCMEFTAVACAKLSSLTDVPDYYVCQLNPSDHVFVVIGEAPDDTGAFEKNLQHWSVDAAICDPWAGIACSARQFGANWELMMDSWQVQGMKLPKMVTQASDMAQFGMSVTGSLGGVKPLSMWMGDSDPYWKRAIHDSDKINKAGPGTGKNSGSRCCYLSTAACRVIGLPDDCVDLQRLRWVRDEVLVNMPQGAAEVDEYYSIAPGVVKLIDQQDNARAVYRKIYEQRVRPASLAVARGDYEAAHEIFQTVIREGRDWLGGGC